MFLFWHYLINTRKEGNTFCTFISFAPLTDSDRRNWWYGRKDVNFHCIYVRESTSKHTDRVFEKEKLFKLRSSKKLREIALSFFWRPNQNTKKTKPLSLSFFSALLICFGTLLVCRHSFNSCLAPSSFRPQFPFAL